MLYAAFLPLMRTPRLPVFDWTEATADLNGLVRFAGRRNLVSTRVPSHFNWPVTLPAQYAFVALRGATLPSVHTYLLTYLLTYSMVQSPSWEANWFAASQEIPRISRNPKVRYHTHKRPPPVSILGQPNPVRIPTSPPPGYPNLLYIHIQT